MRTKKVNRYYCEYCKKSGGASHWIKKHESRCTMNPGRYCGYCKMLEPGRDMDYEQPVIRDLMTILPDPEKYKKHDAEFSGWYFDSCLGTVLKEALPKLRDAASNCPACILAALRQKGIPVPLAMDFDFKKECQEIWDDINAENRENAMY